MQHTEKIDLAGHENAAKFTSTVFGWWWQDIVENRQIT